MRDSTLKGRSRLLVLHLLTDDRSSSSVPMPPAARSSGDVSPGAAEGGDPCAGFITHDWGAIQPIFPLLSPLLFLWQCFHLRESVSLASFLRCCAAAWYTWVFTHGLASPSVKWHEYLSHLAACLSVARWLHVTRLKRFLIGQACNYSVVVHFMLLWCLDRCKPPNRGGARTSETPGWKTPPPQWPSPAVGSYISHHIRTTFVHSTGALALSLICLQFNLFSLLFLLLLRFMSTCVLWIIAAVKHSLLLKGATQTSTG